MSDPYSNVGSSHGSHSAHSSKNVYRNDSAYSSGDAYRTNDPYKTSDPYKVPDHDKSDREGTRPLIFWFGLKARVQDMANSDLGHADEIRIMDSDKDQFKLMLFGSIYTRAIGGIIVAVLSTLFLYTLSIFAVDRFIVIGAFVSFMFMAWILYFPAHQTYTAKEYVIGENSKVYYLNWKRNFNSYQLHIIIAYLVTLVVLTYITFDKTIVVKIFKMIHFTPSSNIDLQTSLIVSVLFTVSGLILYIVFSMNIIKKSEAAQKIFYRNNVVRRTQSQAEQFREMLSSSEIE